MKILYNESTIIEWSVKYFGNCRVCEQILLLVTMLSTCGRGLFELAEMKDFTTFPIQLHHSHHVSKAMRWHPILNKTFIKISPAFPCCLSMTFLSTCNPFPHIYPFWHLCSRHLLKRLWQMEKLLKISNFSIATMFFNFFSHYTRIYRDISCVCIDVFEVVAADLL